MTYDTVSFMLSIEKRAGPYRSMRAGEQIACPECGYYYDQGFCPECGKPAQPYQEILRWD
jgi:rubrerythrin